MWFRIAWHAVLHALHATGREHRLRSALKHHRNSMHWLLLHPPVPSLDRPTDWLLVSREQVETWHRELDDALRDG